jgi:hypothetical protein
MAGTGAVELDRNGDGKIDDDLVANTLTRDAELAAVAASKQNALLYTPENAAAKGVAGGYAELDSGGKLPLARIPDGVGGGVTSYNDLTDKPSIPVIPTGSTGQVPIYDASNVLVPTTVPTVTGAEIGGVFSGNGTYLKKDGTSGDPPGGSGTFAGLTDLPAGVTLTTLGYAAAGATSPLQAQILALSSTSFTPINVTADPTGASANGLYRSTVTGHWWVVDGYGLSDISAGTYSPWDLAPNAYSFTTITGATADGALNCSTAITPDGYDRSSTWSVSGDTGCSAKIAGGSAANSGSIAPGQTISACVNSSSSASTTTSCTPTIGGVAATSAFTVTTTALASISDNFSGTLASWTTRIGEYAIVSGELSATTGGIVEYTQTSTASAEQWAAIKYVTLPSNTYEGIVLRSPGASGNRYRVAWNVAGARWEWHAITEAGVVINAIKVGAIKQDTLALTESPLNNTWGFTITGTGTSTVVYLFKNPVSSQPLSATGWDSATDWTGKMTVTWNPVVVNTGNIVGITSGTASRLDNFSAGSLP